MECYGFKVERLARVPSRMMIPLKTSMTMCGYSASRILSTVVRTTMYVS